jgi:hypothetical protein
MSHGKVLSVTVRMAEETKALWQMLADREDRSMGNYLGWLLKREFNHVHDGTSLETLNTKVDLLLMLVTQDFCNESDDDEDVVE